MKAGILLKTPEYATFKLFLTGVDDGALVSQAREDAASQSKAAKIEMIDELIANYESKIDEASGSPEDLRSQLGRLEESLARERASLLVCEEQYRKLSDRRKELWSKAQNGNDRQNEINELLARFKLLDDHYSSDLLRLEGIREAGLLVEALSPKDCPLCGASPEQQHRDKDCDGNLEAAVIAADVESAKIIQLRNELKDTVNQLCDERDSFARLMPKINEELLMLDEAIKAFDPGLTAQRASYSELVEKRSEIKSFLSQVDQLSDLRTRRESLEKSIEADGGQLTGATDLSSAICDQFALKVESLLKAWNFPEAERVHFEQSDRDLVINGKRRGSRGKGMRAVTHAAFTLGLMEFCKEQDRPHPGFVVLDSPLLAYREPEGKEDDLRGTDVQEKFYEYLAGMKDGQVIIIENTDPPSDIASRPTSVFFSKNPHQGQYGFFPAS